MLLDDGVPSNFPWPNSAKSGLGPLGSLSACNRQVFGTGNLTCCATTEYSRDSTRPTGASCRRNTSRWVLDQVMAACRKNMYSLLQVSCKYGVPWRLIRFKTRTEALEMPIGVWSILSTMLNRCYCVQSSRQTLLYSTENSKIGAIASTSACNSKTIQALPLTNLHLSTSIFSTESKHCVASLRYTDMLLCFV